MEKNANKMKLPTIDEMFTTQADRDSIGNIIKIPINNIDDFPNHPFNVTIDDELNKMVESIKEKGVITPTIVRPKENGRYEMVSGHRRKKASELLQLESLPCIVKDLTDDEATILMVDTNIQREKILPSEKAFAYKLKMEALSHQGKVTSRQVGEKLGTAELIGKDNNESARMVQRYIRLTYLLPKILEYVDNSVIKDDSKLKIALSPAVEISFLNNMEQKHLLDYMECNLVTPSLSQAIDLKNMSQNGTFSVEKMENLLDVEKPNQKPRMGISLERFSPVLPQNLKSDQDREDYIYKAVVFYRQREANLKKKQEQTR